MRYRWLKLRRTPEAALQIVSNLGVVAHNRGDTTRLQTSIPNVFTRYSGKRYRAEYELAGSLNNLGILERRRKLSRDGTHHRRAL